MVPVRAAPRRPEPVARRTPPTPPAVVASPAPAGPPPPRQWDEARPWATADEALADIAEAASIVDASTSGQSLDPRTLALVSWAHQVIELRILIGAKGMETLAAGREPVPRFAVTWAKLRTQRAEIERAVRDRHPPRRQWPGAAAGACRLSKR